MQSTPCTSPWRHLAVLAALALGGQAALAADQTQPGAGNLAAMRIAERSPLVQSSLRFLVAQAGRIHDRALRNASLDFLTNPQTCALHRRGLATPAAQDAIIQQLVVAGLINSADAAAFASGVRVAVFPPVGQAESNCPQLPQPMQSAPGSAYGGHHSYPAACPCMNRTTTSRTCTWRASTRRSTATPAGATRRPSMPTRRRRLPPARGGDLPIDDGRDPGRADLARLGPRRSSSSGTPTAASSPNSISAATAATDDLGRGRAIRARAATTFSALPNR